MRYYVLLIKARFYMEKINNIQYQAHNLIYIENTNWLHVHT